MSASNFFEAVIGVGWLAAVCFAGWAVVSWLMPRLNAGLRAAIAFPLGATLITFVLFAASWAGVPLTWQAVLAATILLPIAGVLLQRRSRGRPRDATAETTGDNTKGRLHPRFIAYLAIALLSVTAATVSLVSAYSVWDGAAIWSVKGYGIALEGTVFAGSTWGAHGLAYPLNIPLQIASLKLLAGDELPISKLIFPLYYASMLLGVEGVAGRRRNVWLAPATVVVLGTTPVVFEHAWVGYANLPLACYILLGSIVTAAAAHDGNWGSVPLAALLLASAAWTRVEGVLYLAAAIASVSLATLMLGKFERTKIIRLGAFSLVFASPWLVFYALYGAGSSQAAGAWSEVIAAWSSGSGDLYPLRLIFGYFRRAAFEQHIWGLFFVVTPGLALLGWRSYVREPDSLVVVLGLSGVAAALVSAVLYYGVYFVSPDFLAWLARDFPRAFLPAALLLFASAATASVASLQSKAGAPEPKRS